MSRQQEFSYRLAGASHHTDRPAHHRQRRRSTKLTFEDELTLDEWVTENPHVDGYHAVIVVSRQHHLDNIEASDAFLKLLNFHHGRTKGYSDGYGNI